MVKKRWLIVAFATFILLITSCASPVNVSCELPDINNPPPKSNSNSLIVNFYIDGTPSMEGYVATNNISRYKRTIDLLESMFPIHSKEVKYKRLGTDSKKISRDQFLRDAKSRKFYNGADSEYALLPVVQIEQAVPSLKGVDQTKQGNQLSVVMTDLHQKGTDVTKISTAIQNNHLNNSENAVGILAIRSEFEGDVYTETEQFPKFYYSTNEQGVEKYRPFYVIFIGKFSDISYFFEEINKEGNREDNKFIKESKFVIFSPRYIIKEPLHLSFTPGKNETIIRRPFSLNNGKVFVEGKKDSHIDLLEIDNNKETELSLDYKVDLKHFAHSLLFEDNSLEAVVESKDLDPFHKGKSNLSLQKALTVKGFKVKDFKENESERKVSFTTQIQPSQIEAGVYSFNVDITATDLQEQPWWKEWNSTFEDIKKRDGSGTYKLEQFLRELKKITAQSMTNGDKAFRLGSFCYAVQKN